MYVREICADLGYDMSEASIIYEDNKACISISEGDTDKKRTKHIAKHFHFVKEKRAAGLVVLKYLATALQIADMLTKHLESGIPQSPVPGGAVLLAPLANWRGPFCPPLRTLRSPSYSAGIGPLAPRQAPGPLTLRTWHYGGTTEASVARCSKSQKHWILPCTCICT